MEAVGAGQELMKWEKTQETNAQEEKILVLVRLRPLSEKEIAVNEVADWECINNTTILYRNTLREGSAYPNAYTFDRVFRGDRSTKNVYEEGAQEIALSVVSGINSSIFAYGQTSSGKTYTMNGITEYTVADIFDYIHRHEERTFSLKLSAIEIYNEVVRDLLGTDVTPLRLLDDHERGTIVEGVTEETLKDWNHFKRLLTICEAQRHIGETSLNEKSSRSHQIIKLTLESSAREFLGKDNSTTLSASVSFVDLAGSERPSQASSAGVRLKEGCHINRSLLTLGTVIRKLSKGRHGHINYRDSKLTRILQPCLGVNARTAIICTLSPARSHVEQTRNALLFACCAKEVSTKAQVNIVMSDKALVKHLQREVARLESELRSPMTPVPVSSSSEYAALLRKKDHQIEKMENDIRELTKQRDFAQSRVEDLLRMVGHEQDSIKTRESKSNHWQRENTLEDDCSASVSSSIADSLSLEVSDVRKLNDPNYYDADSENNPDEQNKKDITKVPIAEDSTDCKEIQCIEMEKASELLDNVPRNAVTGQELISTPVTENREVRQMQTGVFEKRFQNVEKTLASPVGVNPAVDVSNSRNFKVSRSWSCRENLMASSSSLEMAESTPHGFEKWFPERNLPPGHYGERYFRFDSQSSMGSAQSIRTTPDENITSLNTFISGLNQMAKLEPEKQPANENQETQKEIDTNVKVVGLGPMRDSFKISTDWPLEFERQQQMIIELWRTCNVSLIHRTYFFLLFRGDSNDSIYMEVELRRLTFLKDSFSCANQVMEDGRTLTVASSTRDLSREREMLSKLMQKRFSEEERERIFQKWGIALNSKRRRLQLINCLWTDPKDMNHIIESAAIVAKLVRFVEQGHALKGMFGLSFTPPQLKRGSHSWKNSVPYFS